MKVLSRILTALLCCAPFAYANGAGPVATTSGSNLTSFNPSTSYNNQWASMSNGRYDNVNSGTAKADFGNCNTLILRCAQPKCAGGGCADFAIAGPIVSGCVKANDKCKQYGDDLINSMTAQLVASSTAKAKEQEMALEQARIQAEAQAAAANAASEAQAQQMEMMQQQMAQMQQQMVQQQQESAQQLQAALEQQAAQSAAALENMKTAATEAAKSDESGVTAYQQEAIARGISTDVLERQKITGQIMTEIENAEVSLKTVKTAMQTAFDYAGCSVRGDNCTGPKRVAKWREYAFEFIEPYDNTLERIYDGLMDAQMVGVDLSQIYMMLSDSCSSWAQYLCQSMGKDSAVFYGATVPYVCDREFKTDCSDKNKCAKEYQQRGCRPCTFLKSLKNSDDDAVYEGWVNTDELKDGNGTVVACGDNALKNTPLFGRLTKNKNGAGVIPLDSLERWITQTEPNVTSEKEYDAEKALKRCYTTDQDDILKSSISSRTIKKNSNLCIDRDPVDCDDNKACTDKTDDCPYISGTYAICDVHPYNAKITDIKTSTADLDTIRETIGMKVTVISQQMYKQYEYLNATLKRLKIQLQKAVLSANLEAAGAKDGDSSSGSGGLAGASRNDDKTIHLAGAENCSYLTTFESQWNCLQNSVSLIRSNISSNKKNACLQLQSVVAYAESALVGTFDSDKNCKKYKEQLGKKTCADQDKDHILQCAADINNAVMKARQDQEDKKARQRW